MHWMSLLIAPAMGAMILFATGSQPDLAAISGIITAVVGLVGFIASVFRGRANNKRVEEVEQAASYLKGFEGLTKRLQEEIADLNQDIDKERSQWSKEKIELLETIRGLRNELQEHMLNNSVTKNELIELRGQIRGYLTHDQYEEFKRHVE